MNTVGLTRTQRDMMLVIQELIGLDGHAPSYCEIAHEMSLSNVGGVGRIVDILVERGYLDRRPRCARSLIVPRACAAGLLPAALAVPARLAVVTSRGGLDPLEHAALPSERHRLQLWTIISLHPIEHQAERFMLV